ncbi:MAG: sigma-70 family RNA polymerase sigma factor [Waterburya sp.]
MKNIYQVSKGLKVLSREEQELHFKNFKDLLHILERVGLEYNADSIRLISTQCCSKDLDVIQKALKSKDLLILTNQGQVIKQATIYANKILSRDELIQVGNLGLCKALLKFQPSKKTKFSSYAFFWIRAMIFEALQKIDPIYLPPQAKKDIRNTIKYLPVDGITTKEIVYLEEKSLLDDVWTQTNEEETNILEIGLNLFQDHGSLALALHLGCSVADAELAKKRAIKNVKAHLTGKD